MSANSLVVVVSYRNSTSNHNRGRGKRNPLEVVSYRNSTSNHNSGVGINATMSLYLIEILHQTTTSKRLRQRLPRCILSKFYIKPQRVAFQCHESRGCILSKFYIKPQPPLVCFGFPCVVSYRNSTSNHNFDVLAPGDTHVVSYRNSTSNHNYLDDVILGPAVVSYRNSTSNHNVGRVHLSPGLVVSYRNSTSNHNQRA